MSKKMRIGYSMLGMKDWLSAAGARPLAWLCGVVMKAMGLDETELERLALA